ncbi:MAG: hypothetical protein RLZZ09_1600 [Pseudomonadota bacterium]|jgi:hypothetical protein
MHPDNTSSTPDRDAPVTTPDNPGRRDALEKLAVLSAWTVPTTLMLLRSQRASAESLPGAPTDDPGDPGP